VKKLRKNVGYKNWDTSKDIIFIFKLLIIILVFGQRIGITYGDFQIPIIFLVVYCSMFYLMFRRKLLLNSLALFLYIAVILSMTVCVLFANSVNLPYSLLYLISIYLPLIFSVQVNNNFINSMLCYFQKTVVICVLFGILQYSYAFVGVTYEDWLRIIPEDLLIRGYNTYYPVEYGSNIIKSNGIFMLEPSFFSQFIAIAIMLELIYFKNYFRLIIYIIGVIISFSGTGLVMLLVFLFIYIMSSNMRNRMYFFIGSLLCLSILINTTYFDSMLNRVNEFNINSNSSANYRFLSPFLAIERAYWINSNVYLFGFGAGSANRIDIPGIPGGTNYSVIPKLILEYGLISAILFLVFIGERFRKFTVNNKYLILPSLLLMYFFLSGSLLQPQTVYLLFILFGFNRIKSQIS
jgi:hypothetical protein